MADESAQTRRHVLKTSASLATLGALAGCTGDTDQETADGSGSTTTPDSTTPEPTAEPTAEPTPTPTAESGGETPTESSDDGSYTVSIEPVGAVEFEDVPETWVANNGSWADMGVALGVDLPEAVWLTSRYHTQYYDDIPGVSVDKSSMTSLYQSGIDKERFYALDGDVHVMDPNFLENRFKGIDSSDVEEIQSEIAPMFGNTIFSRGYSWHEDYRYYSLYEAFGKLAAVFQRQDRYEAFRALHEEFQSKLAEVVPPEGERPSVAILWPQPTDEPEKFSPYLIDGGTSFKQWRDLGVEDALATTDVKDFHNSRGRIDYETLLKVDPDVLLLRGNEDKRAAKFEETVVSFMEDHTVASQLTAVENGDVYRGGSLYQGPITNLVLTERAAAQVYGVTEELFDRQRVADIVDGDV